MCFRLTSVAPTSLKFVRAHYRSAGIYSPVAVSSAMVPQAPLTVSAGELSTNENQKKKKKKKNNNKKNKKKTKKQNNKQH